MAASRLTLLSLLLFAASVWPIRLEESPVVRNSPLHRLTGLLHSLSPPPSPTLSSLPPTSPLKKLAPFLQSIQTYLASLAMTTAKEMRQQATAGKTREQVSTSLLSPSSPRLSTLLSYPHTKSTQPSIHDVGHSYFPDNNDGFYACIPEFITSVTPPSSFYSQVEKTSPAWRLGSNKRRHVSTHSNLGASSSWSSGCLESNTATAYPNPNGGLIINITSSNLNASAPLCSDMYLLATPEWVDIVLISAAGTTSVSVPVSSNVSTWVAREGVRIFRFIHDPLTTISDALATISLFIPSLTEPTLDPTSQANNLKFIKDYMNIVMEPRSINITNMDWSIVQTGDLLAINRLDGLGTMEMWGTGAATTHFTMAVRMGPDNHLYVAESTAADAYWPLNNIQMNAIETWLPMAQASMYAVVHVPLSNVVREALNQTAAINFILDSIGYPYGYHNFIATFFDTPDGNLPWPAGWQFIEIAFNLLEAVDRSLTDQLLGAALNMRLGTTNLSFVQCADMAAQQNMSIADLIAVPEQDDWVYYDGPAMVCDVFYCNILKAGGVFSTLWGITDAELNCREFHNKDAYGLDIFNLTAPRPQGCIDADPTLPYCQIMGQYRLQLPFANTMTPYPHMNENCAALPLAYNRTPATC